MYSVSTFVVRGGRCGRRERETREVREGEGVQLCQEIETLTDQWLTLAFKSLAIVSSRSTTLISSVLCGLASVCGRGGGGEGRTEEWRVGGYNCGRRLRR